jgi:hypothetical protein
MVAIGTIEKPWARDVDAQVDVRRCVEVPTIPLQGASIISRTIMLLVREAGTAAG